MHGDESIWLPKQVRRIVIDCSNVQSPIGTGYGMGDES